MSSAGIAPAPCRLEDGHADLLHYEDLLIQMVGQVGVAPTFACSQDMHLHSSTSARKIGGLCGLCSRGLPIDNRLLYSLS